MLKKILIALVMILVVVVSVFAEDKVVQEKKEATSEITMESIFVEKHYESIYYQNGKEVARVITYDIGDKAGDKFNGIKKTTGKIPDGIVKHYTSKRLFGEENYKDGLRNGPSKVYWLSEPGQKLMWLTNYKNGKLDGLNVNYYRNGSIHTIQYFENGIEKGDIKTYNEVGKEIENLKKEDIDEIIGQAEKLKQMNNLRK